MAHFENATSDFAFVQGQVSLGNTAAGTYIWGLYRTSSGFQSTPAVLICEKCNLGKLFAKQDPILFTNVRQTPSNARTEDLKFRIADGKLKKIN